MSKQYLEYDVATGNIIDGTGLIVFTATGFKPVALEKDSTSIDDMIKLKNSGFTAEEVIAIKKANL